MAPSEAGGPALSWNDVRVMIEAVAAARYDIKIFIARWRVGYAARTWGAFERGYIVADDIVARLVFTAALDVAALVDEDDTAAAWAYGHIVFLDYHSLGSCDQYIRPPKPLPGGNSIVPDDVVPDDRPKGDFEENARVVISLHAIFVVDDVPTANIAPQSGPDILVDRISAKDDFFAQRELHAPGLPFEVESTGIVRPDAVILDHDILADARDADLTVVMNVVRTNPRAVADLDPAAAV